MCVVPHKHVVPIESCVVYWTYMIWSWGGQVNHTLRQPGSKSRGCMVFSMCFLKHPVLLAHWYSQAVRVHIFSWAALKIQHVLRRCAKADAKVCFQCIVYTNKNMAQLPYNKDDDLTTTWVYNSLLCIIFYINSEGSRILVSVYRPVSISVSEPCSVNRQRIWQLSE